MSDSTTTTAAARPRKSRLAALTLFLCLVATVALPVQAADAQQQQILFGFNPPANGNKSQSLQRIEQQLGNKLGLVRVFMRWDESAQQRDYHREIIDGGRTMHVSVRAKRRNGTKMSWSSIANANPGSQIHNEIIKWADYLKTLNGDVWFTFNHEPEIRENDGQGSPAQYRAAYRKIHQIFDQRGATNVQHAWVMSSYSYELQVKKPGDRRAAKQWYPGDDVVDMIGSDPYDWSNCRADNAVINRPMSDLLQYFLTFSRAHPNKKLVLGEWGSTLNRNFGTQAGFIDGTRETLKRSEWSQMAGISYFASFDGAFPNCKWDPRGNADSMAALRRMQNDAAFGGANAGGGGDNPPPPEEPPPAGKLTNIFNGSVNSGGWRAHYFTPSTSGKYRIVVKWNGSARLRTDLRRSSNNSWLGANVSEQNPSTYTATVTAGQRLQLAVWSRSGSANYDVEVWRQ